LARGFIFKRAADSDFQIANRTHHNAHCIPGLKIET
jgi:hypothetical protein